MPDRIFVDTNVLVYAHDLDAGSKNGIACDVITDLWTNQNGILSTQVLQEFYITITKKVSLPLNKETARKIIRRYANWELTLNDAGVILQASEIEERHQISFWDALIVSAAYSKNADILLTEDLNNGQYIEGILVKNPFYYPFKSDDTS
ncbi:MAG: PIN domain-containing protein [Thermodesulfobacteriota bacterium]